MTAVFGPLQVVLPIFALILAGWLARRCGVLGADASSELNRFVVYLALPALLFDIVAHAHWSEIWQAAFIVTFGLSAALTFCIALAVGLLRARALADCAIDGLNAAYPNTGYMGFPLALSALGASAMAPTLIATIMTVCVVFAAAIVLIESRLHAGRRPLATLAKVAGQLVRNPLLVAPALGALVPIFGLALPVPAETFLKMLGGAASPCALVTLGLFLAAERHDATRNTGSVALFVTLKLIVQPVAAWLIARALGLSPLLTHAAVLIAALPTGTGPFMLAEFYKRDAGVTARVILVSTVISVVTITAYLSAAL